MSEYDKGMSTGAYEIESEISALNSEQDKNSGLSANKGGSMNGEPKYQTEKGPSQGLNFDQLVDGSHKYTDVLTDGYVGPGNAHHHYLIRCKERKEGTRDFVGIRFQDGPIKEFGVNGVVDENLIAIVIDRLRGFQDGAYKCRENALALTKLEESLMWLKERTRSREIRGVEGTHKV